MFTNSCACHTRVAPEPTARYTFPSLEQFQEGLQQVLYATPIHVVHVVCEVAAEVEDGLLKVGV